MATDRYTININPLTHPDLSDELELWRENGGSATTFVTELWTKYHAFVAGLNYGTRQTQPDMLHQSNSNEAQTQHINFSKSGDDDIIPVDLGFE